MSTTHVVANRAQFDSALGRISDGDVIALAPGGFGGLTLRDAAFAKGVTITSLDPASPAVVESMNLSGSRNVTVEGVAFARDWPVVTNAFYTLLRLDNTQGVVVRDNTFTGSVVNDGSKHDGRIVDVGIYGRDVRDATIEGNHLEGTHRGVSFGGLYNSTIRGNMITDYREDGMSLAYVSGSVIAGNVVRNPIRAGGDHLDYIQIRQVRDTVIDSNFLVQGNGEPSQGIFIGSADSDPAWNHGLTIVNNIVHGGMRNALYLTGMSDSTVANNVVLTHNRNFHNASLIIQESPRIEVVDNVVSGSGSSALNVVSGGGVYRGSVWMNGADVFGPAHHTRVLANANVGGEARPSDFAVVAPHLLQGGRSPGVDVERFAAVEALLGLQPAPGPTQALSLRGIDWSSHLPGDQDFGAIEITDGGVKLTGNVWKQAAGPVALDPRSVIAVDVTIDNPGEIVGIGFLRDGRVLPEHAFAIAGSQNWGHRDAWSQWPAGTTRTVVIEVGRFVKGAFDGLVLIGDDDARAATSVVFSNLRLTNALAALPGSVDAGPAPADPEPAPDGGLAPPDGSVALLQLDFSDGARSFDARPHGIGPQDFGFAETLDGGATLRVGGNGWKHLPQNFTVVDGMTLSFEFAAPAIGEIHGVGLVRPRVNLRETTFALAGTQDDFGLLDFRADGIAPGEWRRFDIVLSDYVSGDFSGLLFIMDNDAAPAVGESLFRNVALSAPDPHGATPPADAFDFVDVTSPDFVDVARLDFTDAVRSFDARPHGIGPQDFGLAETLDGGATVRLSDNGWKYVAQSVDVVDGLTLSFEFAAPAIGEIHGVGLVRPRVNLRETTFALAGTQDDFGLLDFRADGIAPGEWRRFDIVLSDYVSGSFDGFVFIMDNDEEPAVGESLFRNVTLSAPDPMPPDPMLPDPMLLDGF
ncbi:right-handed parallel beta-helix repeat-containing protein [Rubrimonas sp.]|uniref:right-handed parallel beta-helix repeat-containing protein n=1 Tax=Rubrimonas sp. TaxID=2036015 RepID=UPI002FDDA893